MARTNLIPQMRQLLPGAILTEDTRCIMTGAYWRMCAQNAVHGRTLLTEDDIATAYAKRAAFNRMAMLVEGADA